MSCHNYLLGHRLMWLSVFRLAIRQARDVALQALRRGITAPLMVRISPSPEVLSIWHNLVTSTLAVVWFSVAPDDPRRGSSWSQHNADYALVQPPTASSSTFINTL